MEEVIFVRGGIRENQGTGNIAMGNDFIPEKFIWDFFHPRMERNETLLTLFDYTESKIKQWKNWDGTSKPQTLPTNEVAMKNNSIIDLYDYIKDIGDSSPQSLVELQFFTHGYSGGPVIVNTYEKNSFVALDNARDPDDKDPRKKDFNISSVLGGSEGLRFKKAFSSQAHVKIWGCSYEQDQIDILRGFFRARNTTEKKRIQTAYVIYVRDSSYHFTLHKTIDIPVFASPIGWGTDPYLPVGINGEKALDAQKTAKYRGIFPPRSGEPWWKVSPYFRPHKGFEFYKKILRARFDELDYVAYESSIIRLP